MNDRVRQALSKARGPLAKLSDFGREHRFWIESATLTLLGLAAVFSFGYASLRREAALEARIAELRQLDARYDRWTADLQLPTPAESLAWRASDRDLMDLGDETSRSLTVARMLAGRAAEVGVSNLRIHLAHPDSVPSVEPVSLGGWTVEPAGEGLIVEFDAEVAGIMGFLAALPVQAAVSELHLSPAGDVLHARVVIATRQILRNG